MVVDIVDVVVDSDVDMELLIDVVDVDVEVLDVDVLVDVLAVLVDVEVLDVDVLDELVSLWGSQCSSRWFRLHLHFQTASLLPQTTLML